MVHCLPPGSQTPHNRSSEILWRDDDDVTILGMTAVVLATAGYDHKIRFWEASSRVCTRTVRYPDSHVNCLAISQDKLYLAAGGNPHVREERN